MGDLHPPAAIDRLVVTGPAGAVDDAVARVAADAAADAAGGATPDWLAPRQAVQVTPGAGIDAAAAVAALRTALADRPVDVNGIAAAGRRKKLLLADMDSTIVDGETLDDLARHAGRHDEIAAVTRRAMTGALDFETALRDRVARLAGLPEQAIADTLAGLALIPGAMALVATMRAAGAHCVLVSGGFEPFTRRVRDWVGFHEDRSNRLDIADGRLTGRVLDPILGRTAKLETLRALAVARGLRLDETVAVGDGANDLAMLGAAGFGIAFRAKPVVAAAAALRLDHSDLTGLLYLQGYRADEIVTPPGRRGPPDGRISDGRT